MTRLACAALLTCLMLPAAAPAQLAEVICDDRARLEQRLATVQGATRQGQGLRGPDTVLEIWVAPDSGDWILVQSYSSGTACIVAMGESWEAVPAPARADPA